MPTVRVVTDSSADLPAELIDDLPITVLPVRVALGGETYLHGVDLDAAQIQARAKELMERPTAEPPDLLTFTRAYASLSRTTDSIISIHGSQRLGDTVAVAEKARGYHYDRCQIVVVDSESASMGLGYVVLEAGRLARAGVSLRQIADVVRQLVHQTHVIFVADASEGAAILSQYLPQPARASGGAAAMTAPAAAAVAPPPTSSTARPVLKLEEGRIVPLEQVRNRTKALERLYEFVEIFPHVEDLTILHGRSNNDVEWLLKRIDPIFPRKRVRVVPYGPAMTRFVGVSAVGVVAYEGVDG